MRSYLSSVDVHFWSLLLAICDVQEDVLIVNIEGSRPEWCISTVYYA